jgi:hypothetical protein
LSADTLLASRKWLESSFIQDILGLPALKQLILESDVCIKAMLVDEQLASELSDLRRRLDALPPITAERLNSSVSGLTADERAAEWRDLNARFQGILTRSSVEFKTTHAEAIAQIESMFGQAKDTVVEVALGRWKSKYGDALSKMAACAENSGKDGIAALAAALSALKEASVDWDKLALGAFCSVNDVAVVKASVDFDKVLQVMTDTLMFFSNVRVSVM